LYHPGIPEVGFTSLVVLFPLAARLLA